MEFGGYQLCGDCELDLEFSTTLHVERWPADILDDQSVDPTTRWNRNSPTDFGTVIVLGSQIGHLLEWKYMASMQVCNCKVFSL